MDGLDGVLAVILNITYILLRIDKDTRAGKQEDFISISLFSHFALIYCFQVRRSRFFFQLLSLSNDSPQTGNSKCAQQSLKCTQLRRDVIWRCQGNCETFVDMKKSILTCAVKLIFLKRWKKITRCASLLCPPWRKQAGSPTCKRLWLWSFELLSTHKNAPQPEYI